jgi:hypothetical protein
MFTNAPINLSVVDKKDDLGRLLIAKGVGHSEVSGLSEVFFDARKDFFKARGVTEILNFQDFRQYNLTAKTRGKTRLSEDDLNLFQSLVDDGDCVWSDTTVFDPSAVSDPSASVQSPLSDWSAVVSQITDNMNAKFFSMSVKFDAVNAKIDTLTTDLHTEISGVNKRIDQYDAKFTTLVCRVDDLATKSSVCDLAGRVSALEHNSVQTGGISVSPTGLTSTSVVSAPALTSLPSTSTINTVPPVLPANPLASTSSVFGTGSVVADPVNSNISAATTKLHTSTVSVSAQSTMLSSVNVTSPVVQSGLNQGLSQVTFTQPAATGIGTYNYPQYNVGASTSANVGVYNVQPMAVPPSLPPQVPPPLFTPLPGTPYTGYTNTSYGGSNFPPATPLSAYSGNHYYGSNYQRGPNTKMPKFDGKSVQWQAFIGQFESLVKRYGWQHEQAERLGDCLSGQVLEFYHSFPQTVRDNYVRIKQELESVYSAYTDSSSKLFVLLDTVQTTDESVYDYAAKIIKLANEACPGDPDAARSMAISVFLRGCKNQELVRLVVPGKPASVQEALQAMCSFVNTGVIASLDAPLMSDSTSALPDKSVEKSIDKSAAIRSVGMDNRNRSPGRNSDRSWDDRSSFAYNRYRGSPNRYSDRSPDNRYSVRYYRGTPPRNQFRTSDSRRFSDNTSEYESSELRADISSLATGINQIKSDVSSHTNLLNDMNSKIITLDSRVTTLESAQNSNSATLFKSPPRTSSVVNSAPGSPRSPSGKCFKCQQPGHFARNCPLGTPTRSSFDNNWRNNQQSPKKNVSFVNAQTVKSSK